MKQPDYRRVVLFITVVVSLSIVITLASRHAEPTHPAMVINNKSISENQFNKMFSKKAYLQNKNDFIHSVIVKELLIQEALKAGIQKEESFRQSVQGFYEQSLIKIIMDRKYASLKPDIDESIIDRYVDWSDKTVDLTLLTYKQLEDISTGIIENEEHIRLPFNRLSIEVKYELLQLQNGHVSPPLFSETDNNYSVFRLDNISQSEIKTDKEENRDMIRQLLSEQYKEQMIAQWLDGLREHAEITLGDAVNQVEK